MTCLLQLSSPNRSTTVEDSEDISIENAPVPSQRIYDKIHLPRYVLCKENFTKIFKKIFIHLVQKIRTTLLR